MKNKIIYLILFLLSLLSIWRLCRSGYPSMQDDIQVFRLEQFDQCLKDGQIPCRYIADGGLGYGYPLYNFYSPLPYGVAEFFHLFGFSFIDSVKISFIIPAFLRTFGMYFLASAFFGTSGGILSAALFTFAPYQALNTFVRGAIAETWALSLLPLVFWSIYKRKNKTSILFLSALFLSHNLTLLYALPLLFIFNIYHLNFKYFFRSFLWSFSLCAFFLLPAFFEKNLTTVETMTQGYFAYIVHFVTLKELFISPFWGYSASMWGPVDGLSFSLGLFQWLLATLTFFYVLFRPKIAHRNFLIIFYIIGLFLLFLTHSKSTFIWQHLPFIAYFQFPWRFLAPVVFCFSFVGAAFINIFSQKLQKIILPALGLIIILINLPYFQEDIWYQSLNDSQKLNYSEYIRQSAAGLKDYWPKYSRDFPESYAPALPINISGQADYLNFQKNSHYASSIFYVTTDSATINFPIVYFPNWQLVVDGQNYNYKIDENLGLIQADFSKGQHKIVLKFVDTPLRRFANAISLLTILSFIIFISREKRS